MPIKSQGTHVYIVDAITTPQTPALVKLVCPASISGVGGGAKDQIDVTCLDETENRSFISGLSSPTALSIPYNFDPAQVSHKLLTALKTDGSTTQFIICLSDGTAVPTLAAGVITAPTGRTSVSFTGYVSENAIEIATNEVIKGTLSVQRSGNEVWTYKA